MTIAKKTPNSKTKRRMTRTWIGIAVAVVAFSGVLIAVGSAPGEASLVSSDGITTLATTGTVTPGPYASGQTIEITGTANSVLNNANLVANAVPGQTAGNPTGAFYFEECTDPGGLVANLPTTSSGCEAATIDFTSVTKTSDGSFDVPSYTVYDLPDPGTLGSATMVGTCDVAPNTCVVGIFAENPGPAGSATHTFSRRPSTSTSETDSTSVTILATAPPRHRPHRRPPPCRPRSRAAVRAGRASACRRGRP